MDELTIPIDELVLDGFAPLDEDSVAAAIRRQVSESLDSSVVSEVGRAIARSLARVNHLPEIDVVAP